MALLAPAYTLALHLCGGLFGLQELLGVCSGAWELALLKFRQCLRPRVDLPPSFRRWDRLLAPLPSQVTAFEVAPR